MTAPVLAGSRTTRTVVAGALLVFAAPLMALLVAGGQSGIALGLLLAIPGLVFLYRNPFIALPIWLLVTPLVTETSGAGLLRKVFWVFHRGLPLLAVLAVLVAALSGKRRLPRLGWAELAIAGYVVISLVSIAYTSGTALTTFYLFFDRVLAPVSIYLLVRLLEPTEEQLKKLVTPLAIFIAIQTFIGMASWVAPGMLPDHWLERLGTRTIGSLGHPNVFGVSMLTAALVMIHALHTDSERPRQRRWLFGVAIVMVFMTFSRASWVAGAVVVLGLWAVYRRFMTRFLIVGTIAISLLVAVGTIGGQMQFARDRLLAEESALSRLPVVYASVRMFGAKPLTGWGYGNFDKFDRSFQGQVGDIVFPEKDHASHNLYLTILAEQGLPGLVLFLGPAIWWFVRYRRGRANLESDGFANRKLLALLWLALVAHLVVNNFSNMRVEFGLGMWWLTLGLVGSLEARTKKTVEVQIRDGGRLQGLMTRHRLRLSRPEETSWQGR